MKKSLSNSVAFSVVAAVSLTQVALAKQAASVTKKITVASASTSKKPTSPVQKSGQSAAITKGTASKNPSADLTKATAAGTTTASAKPSWKDSLSSVLISNLAGPAVGNLATSQPDSATGQLDTSSPIRTENTLLVGMRLANGASVGAAANFVYSPIADTGFQMQDPFISISKPLVNKKGYTLNSQLRAYAPVSDAAQAANLIGRARLVMIQNYTPSGSRWNVGLFSYAQSYVYNGNRTDGATRMKFLLEPSINYQIKPTLSAGLMYDMLARNRYDQPFFSFMTADETALSPNVSWDVNSRLNLSPYLSIPTGKRIAADTSTINVLLSMRLL